MLDRCLETKIDENRRRPSFISIGPTTLYPLAEGEQLGRLENFSVRKTSPALSSNETIPISSSKRLQTDRKCLAIAHFTVQSRSIDRSTRISSQSIILLFTTHSHDYFPHWMFNCERYSTEISEQWWSIQCHFDWTASKFIRRFFHTDGRGNDLDQFSMESLRSGISFGDCVQSRWKYSNSSDLWWMEELFLYIILCTFSFNPLC